MKISVDNVDNIVDNLKIKNLYMCKTISVKGKRLFVDNGDKSTRVFCDKA
jgi:hypothetical protein